MSLVSGGVAVEDVDGELDGVRRQVRRMGVDEALEAGLVWAHAVAEPLYENMTIGTSGRPASLSAWMAPVP